MSEGVKSFNIMTVQIGTKLGPYEILAPIGAGGMGEVWKARDTRLNRTVAIKVAKGRFSDRFEREAHAVAALNHPNICTLYDVGPDYLVMEYVEGQPLQGPVPLNEALSLAGQILDALDAAHRKGVIHRDLKPGNILVTNAGVKVLDFGLAKIERGPSTTTLAETKPLTEEGAILGTLHYMSPEQVEGQEADARSDIFAFGLVFYELITGKQAFEGRSRASLVASILKEQPRPLSELQPLTPKPLERVVQTCLEKDPEKRWQSAREVKHALEWITAEAPLAPAPARKSRVPQIAAAAMTLIAIAALWAWWRGRPVEQPLKPLVRLEVDLGSDVSQGIGARVILSPDGKRLVYVSEQRLFTRLLDESKATELAGTEGAYAPFFSPDGQWVAFFAQGKLKKVSVEGGAPVALCDSTFGSGGSWGEDGNIIVALTFGAALTRVSSSGGAPTPVGELAQGEATQRWPQVLPGGNVVLFTSDSVSSNSNFDSAEIKVVSLVDRHSKTLVRGGTFGRYLPSGHIVYIDRGTLFAVAFDLDRLEVHGTPVPLLDQVAYSVGNGSAQLDFSRAGTVVYHRGTAVGLVTVQWLDGAGKTQPLLAKPGLYLRGRLSPDNQRYVLELNGDLWIYDWQRDTMTRLTFSNGQSAGPLWSPDGRFIAFRLVGEGISWVRADGAGKPQSLTQSKNLQIPYSFGPDGKRLAVIEAREGTGQDLWILPLESDSTGLRAGKPEVFLQTAFQETEPAFSPDGRWLAYASDESGTLQVYVRAFPDTGGKWQVSNNGGFYPEWSRNTRELFFETLDNRIMVAGYTAKGDSFVPDKPRLWSEKRLAGGNANRNYDVASDGKRIAALMPAETPETEQSPTHVTFLLNFFDELRRRVPTPTR